MTHVRDGASFTKYALREIMRDSRASDERVYQMADVLFDLLALAQNHDVEDARASDVAELVESYKALGAEVEKVAEQSEEELKEVRDELEEERANFAEYREEKLREFSDHERDIARLEKALSAATQDGHVIDAEQRDRVAKLEARIAELELSAKSRDEAPWLDELLGILGWRGGTIHNALAEVRRLDALEPELRLARKHLAESRQAVDALNADAERLRLEVRNLTAENDRMRAQAVRGSTWQAEKDGVETSAKASRARDLSEREAARLKLLVGEMAASSPERARQLARLEIGRAVVVATGMEARECYVPTRGERRRARQSK